MADPIVSVNEFSTYLNNPDLDEARAALILRLAQTLCESIVTPLPAGAEVVVLDVAERAYAMPAATRDQGLGLYSEGVGPFQTTSPGMSGGGLWLSQQNKQTLRRLAGSGGAFTIDTTPSTAGQNLPWWDTGESWYGADFNTAP